MQAESMPVIVLAFNGPIAGGKSSLVKALYKVLRERKIEVDILSFSGDAAALAAEDLGREPDTRRIADRELVCAKAFEAMEKDYFYFDNKWFNKLSKLTGSCETHPWPKFILADSLRLTRTLSFLGSKTQTANGKPILPFAYTPFKKDPSTGVMQEFSYLNHAPRYDTILKFEKESEEVARWIALREADGDSGAAPFCRHYTLPVLARLQQIQPKMIEKILFASIHARKPPVYEEDDEGDENENKNEYTDAIDNSNSQQARYILHKVATTLKVSPYSFKFTSQGMTQ